MQRYHDLVVVRIKKKLVTDPDTKCMSLAKWLETAPLADLLKVQVRVAYEIVFYAGMLVPYITIDGTDVVMCWDNDSDNQRRFFYVSIRETGSVRYQIATRLVVNDDYDWRYVTDRDIVGQTLRQMALYAMGTSDAKTRTKV